MSLNRRMPGWAWPLAGLLVVVLLAGSLSWPRLRQAMHAWTGEDKASEQVKGTVALLLSRLTQPALDLAPYTPIRYADECPYGVNTFLEQEVEPAKVARSLDMVRAAGFHFVRQEFPWEDIEISAKGDFWDHKWNVSAWAKYDRIVEMANERGLELIVRLDRPPAWSHPAAAAGSYGPPDRLEDFGDFVAAVVSRYRGKVRYYQIWNEPNIYPEWGEGPVDAAAYTRLLQEAYRRAKAADPDCVILSAGLAPTLEKGPRNLSDLTYLQQMYDAGARGYFDIMGVMAYGLWTGPTDHRLGPERTNFARPQLIRAIMVRNGDADKPIWAMEIGWNAQPPDLPAPPSFGRVSREVQARYAVDAYKRAQAEWPWMGTLNYWFLKRATDSEKSQPFYYFNLLEPDFTPWPAYTALQDYMTAPAPLYAGYHQESHWTLHYSGPWQSLKDASAVLGGYRRGEAGASLTFSFWGSELDLVTYGPADPAALAATIDGRPVRARAAGPTALALFRGASPGLHSVEIRVAAGHSLAVDGVIVRPTDRRGLYALVGLAVAAAAAGAAFAIGRRRRGRPGITLWKRQDP